MNNGKQYDDLRMRNSEFIYEGYDMTVFEGNLKIRYYFTQPGVAEFAPQWTFPVPPSWQLDENRHALSHLVFHLGMVELVSYWKACCAPQVVIRAGYLDEEQMAWWRKLYYHGLGEFFYRNGIQAEKNSFMHLVCESEKSQPLNCRNESNFHGNLVPIGGGKDSVVTLELLSHCKDNKCYIINPRGATLTTAKIAGYDNEGMALVKRTIDKELLRLNREGYLNGHTPFSAIVAFSAHLYAYLDKKAYIVLSNESSANEAYVAGTDINHQYSKSIEFENDFRAYVKKYLNTGSEYLSLLRPWNEWRIVQEFVKHEKYFHDFRSCNAGSKENIWCAACSKCLYVYIMLRAFLSNETVKGIFGKDLLDDISLLEDFNGLVCDQFDKPFECVGTRDEINCALTAIVKQYQNKESMPLLLKVYEERFMENKDYQSVCTYYDNHNNVTGDFEKIIMRGNDDKQ